MADSTCRYVTIYDLAVAVARAHGLPRTNLTPETFLALQEAVENAAAAKKPLCDEADASGRRLYLADMRVSPRAKHMVLLWTLADPTEAAQCFWKRGANTLRPATKADDEDVCVSAHLVVNFDVPHGSFSYLAGLEDHEGIPRTRVQNCLQGLLNTYVSDVEAVLEDGITKNGRPKLLLDAHRGRIIKKTNLKPSFIELIKSERRNALIADDGPAFRQVSQRITYKLVREGTAAALRQALVEFAAKLQLANPTSIIRVRWSDPDNDRNAGDITKLDVMDQPQRLLERALTRTALLDGFRALPDATDRIIDRLADRMLQAVRDVGQEDSGGAKQ